MNQQMRRTLSGLPLFLIPALAIGIFWQFSSRMTGPGFPLDDAFIHQTYARNLAETRVWAFQAGQASGGSTSPLWTALMLPGHFLQVPPAWWAMVVGFGTLLALIIVARWWLKDELNLGGARLNLLASLIALEWHLVWAALSGMETLMAGGLALLFLWLLAGRKSPPWLLGAVIGLGVWVRPDLLSLTVPAAWYWFFESRPADQKLPWVLRFGLGILLLFIPYLLLQWSLSGSPWPTTFYAKQAEYAVLRHQPWLARFGQQWVAPLAGPLVLILPAVAYWAWQMIRLRRWSMLASLVWVLTYLATFATRLPVTYQHGRYAMPIIPVLLVLGIMGFIRYFAPTSGYARIRWIIDRAWVAATVLIGLVFIILGARAYSQDVAFIETEMVDMAHWIRDNTQPEAIIAAHDIGALGYYGDRQIVDLAGLVSPEVIPIIRDQAALAELLDENGVQYLMTFPDWYPSLVEDLPVVHSTAGVVSPAMGGTNLTLYSWTE